MLTFLIFSRNDHQDEELRVNLSLESLIDQETKDHYEILFYDLSEPGKEIPTPKSPKLKTVFYPVKFGRDFFPAYIRNLQALEAKTRLICFTNADCVYSKNFAQCIIEVANRNENNLVMCERHNAKKEDMIGLKSIQACREFAQRSGFAGGTHACGECMCVHRNTFVKKGGFYRLITDGKAQKGNWFEHAWAEDTWITGGDANYNHEWVSEKTRILHLFHVQRANAVFRNEEQAKEK